MNKKPARSSGNTATLVLLNKPWGVVSQFSGDDNTLADLVPLKGVYPAGRLDKDSEGLLLLTDNGVLQHKIANPQHKLEKRYWVQVEGHATAEALQKLRDGVILKDGPAVVVRVSPIDQPANLWQRNPPIRNRKAIPTSWIDLCIAEGRNRQVRRMTAAAGLPTLRLIRHRVGLWSINNITPGTYRIIEINTTKSLL